MRGITVTRPVVVKVKVTERYKKIVVTELQKAVQQLDLELQRLEFHKKKLAAEAAKKNPQAPAYIEQQLESQIYERRQKKERLIARIKEIGALAPGTEIVHGRVESFTEIKVGDNWNQVMNVEILVEDGVVIEIRQGRPDSDGGSTA